MQYIAEASLIKVIDTLTVSCSDTPYLMCLHNTEELGVAYADINCIIKFCYAD